MGTRLELTVVAVVRLAKVCIVRDIELYAGLQNGCLYLIAMIILCFYVI